MLGENNTQVMTKATSKLSQTQLEDFLSEMRHEPQWRSLADKCQRYYDGEQRESRILVKMKERGLPPLIRNEIAPAIDILLGMEAKNKTRSKISSDSKQTGAEEVARALTAEVIKTERQTRADRACSDAYGDQVKSGLGWVEVAQEDNKFLGDMRVQRVHRGEIYWDWRHKRPDLMDCRYVIRRQFLDKDIVKKTFPKHKELIDHTLSSWANWDAWETSINHEYLSECYDLEHSRTTIPQDEWISTDRQRICVYEVWYRVYENILVFTDKHGITREFDKKDLRHVMLLASGLVKLEKSLTSKVRIAWWIGPHLISDEPSPYNHNFYPYVPFWGFKDDEHSMPYALIKRMLPIQDEINARISKLMDILSSKRVTMDDDALSTKFNNINKVREQIASANSFVVLNKNRLNKDGFKVETDIPLSDRQFELLMNASNTIKEISGINSAMQGQFSSKNQSGIAVNSLIEQGNTGTAELNDNFRYAKTLVSELILAGVKAKIGDKPHTVNIEKEDDEEIIELNHPTVDENGMEYISNSVMQSRTEVEIEEIPSHQSVKQQQFTDTLDFVKLLPPEYMAAVADKLVMTSDLEYKKEIAETFRQLSGMSNEEQSPEQAEAAMLQKIMQELALRKEQAIVAKEEATADKIKSETVNNRVESTYSAVQSAGSLAQVPQLIPTADTILQSAGFDDQNDYPVANVQMTDGVQPPAQALPEGNNLATGNTNTSPMFPPRMDTPENGMNDGIETQTTEDNI